jgi:ABC-2 type transport system permease protein/oleandomycin transport system permease protein
MSVATTETDRRRSGGTSLAWVVSDMLTITKRNLLKYVRLPTLLVFSTIQPVMFVLLFRYVFSGAISGSLPKGIDYVNYLMPGIFVQTVIFGSTQTGVGLAEDLAGGLIERFKSLPMARSAVLTGRTLSDAVRNTFVVLLMTVVGYLVGFRFHGTPIDALLAILLAVTFGYAFSWISAWIGLAAGNVEAAQAASFVWIFPLVFASSAFVPVASMPGWLQSFAKVNPISITVDAARELALHRPDMPFGTDLLHALLWLAGILVVFVPLAVARYRKVT